MTTSMLSESFHLGDRHRSDGCPGALKMHVALDGHIGRIRVPGGQVSPGVLENLADLADTFGDGNIHITSRGNLQIRGIHDTDAFTQAVIDHGLLPSKAHDRMRNIIVSPLGFGVHDLVAELDEAILQSPEVASLSGRTLFGIDAGEGDIVSHNVDIGVIDQGHNCHIILGGTPAGIACKKQDAAHVMVALAQEWAQLRGSAWRIHEKPEVHGALLTAISDVTQHDPVPTFSNPPGRPIGWIEHNNMVHLGAGLRFGVLPSQLARMIAVIGVPVTITPWHSIVIHHVSEDIAEQVVRVLAPLGLIFDAESAWLRVTACTGLPGCGKSPTNTRENAEQHVASGNVEDGLIHFSGCERRCGHPLGNYTDYLATAENEYEIGQR